jgi:hypothetical protein
MADQSFFGTGFAAVFFGDLLVGRPVFFFIDAVTLEAVVLARQCFRCVNIDSGGRIEGKGKCHSGGCNDQHRFGTVCVAHHLSPNLNIQKKYKTKNTTLRHSGEQVACQCASAKIVPSPTGTMPMLINE